MNGLSASGWVFAGAGLGAVCRYWLGTLIANRSFPWSTLCVNLLGGLLIGIVASSMEADSPSRNFWMVGVLGGFTTFSAFSIELVSLFNSKAYGAAFSYFLATNVGAIGFCALGYWLRATFAR
ncbi:MAG: fluoride efflux transporter CrcB [Chthonomonas sp.]|nr:fluoride efflux transporter CrcB [Chthonomonas sp.]